MRQLEPSLLKMAKCSSPAVREETMEQEYERIDGTVEEFNEITGLALVRVNQSESTYQLHAAAFIGGPLRLVRPGDRVKISVKDGTALAGRIVTR